jgi:hypothetical protein
MSKRFGSFIVVCIEEGYPGLTKGKDYEIDYDCVIEAGSKEETYIVINDYGHDEPFYSDLFKRKSLLREEKLKELGL